MAILVTDTTIWTMDDEFRLLVACNIPTCVYCFLLRVMYRGRPLVASTFDSPTLLMRNNMLVFSGHDGSPTVELWKSQPAGRVVNGRPL